MKNNLEDDIKALVVGMDEQQSNQEPETYTPQDDIQDVYVLIVREHEVEEDQSQVVDSTTAVTTHPAPVPIQKDSFLSAYLFVYFSLFLILSTLAFQLYCIYNPPVATVTIMPKSQTVTLNGTVQLGRLLPPLTISQSQTTPATGRGHQDARAAIGTVTFYNGLFTQQFVTSGTVYTGRDGVAIVTTQDAPIPPGDPSAGYGTLTVAAQAIAAGTSGNIHAGDVNIMINNGLLVRNNQFTGGQDEKTYTIVTQHDIHSISTVLKSSLNASMQGALNGQLQPNEQVYTLPCSPTVTSDHQAGEEAQQVKVTVSQTCSAVAFNIQELATKATTFLATQAQHTTVAGYSLFGSVHVSLKQASLTSTPHPLVFLSFQASGTWIYGLSRQSQEHMKKLIAGKPKDQALKLIASVPGIAKGLIAWGDNMKLPKNIQSIHIIVFVS